MTSRSPRRRYQWGGRRRGAGRRPEPESRRRTRRVMLSLTEAEHRRLTRVAGRRPLAAFARELLLRALSRPQR